VSAPATSTSVPTPATSTSPPRSTTSSSATTPAAHNPPAPDTDVRLPAKFTIRAGGVLDPPQIGAPKHTDVAMTVVSGDGMSHTFGLDTPRPHLAMVLSGRPIKLLLKGLLNGTYAVEIDRVKRGALVIGAAPGP